MEKKCACGGGLQEKVLQDISYDPVQECQKCGTVFVNRRMLQEIEKVRKQRKQLA